MGRRRCNPDPGASCPVFVWRCTGVPEGIPSGDPGSAPSRRPERDSLAGTLSVGVHCRLTHRAERDATLTGVPNPAPESRPWIDVEQGARSAMLRQHRGGRPRPGPDPGCVVVRPAGCRAQPRFYYPRSARVQFGVPPGEGPLMVLLDDIGDQVWLSGASCQPEGLPAARQIAGPGWSARGDR